MSRAALLASVYLAMLPTVSLSMLSRSFDQGSKVMMRAIGRSCSAARSDAGIDCRDAPLWYCFDHNEYHCFE